MNKITAFLVGTIILLAIPASYKLFRQSLDRYSKNLIHQMENKELKSGVHIKGVSFSKAEIALPDAMIWHGVQVKLRLSEDTSFLKKQELVLNISQIKLVAVNLFDHDFLLLLDGIDAASEFSSGIHLFFTRGQLHIKLKLNPFRPGMIPTQLRENLTRAAEIFRAGKTRTPLNCSGLLSVPIQNERVNALLRTTMDEDGYYILVINEEFFKNTAWLADEQITDAEARILSRHPFRVKELIQIMQTARKESEKYSQEETIPEDAYRHVLWSYLLTVQYGPEFAKMLTDAHELGDYTNTQAEHEMDYKNNAIGREYAAMGVSRHEILSRLLNDADVVRKPRH